MKDKKEIYELLIKLRKKLHEIPEVSMQEEKTKHALIEFSAWAMVRSMHSFIQRAMSSRMRL